MANITRKVDKFGSKEINVITDEGCSVTIVSFLGTNTLPRRNIGVWAPLDEKGHGEGKPIRSDSDRFNIEQIEYHIENLKRIIWLNEEEKEALRSFLLEMRAEYDKLKRV